VRIIIAGPPKAGNVWLKCLLGTIYDLRPLTQKETPARPRTDLFRDWAAAGNFADGTIFHQHYAYEPALCDAIEALPAHAVTIVRDPYDTFVSSYHTIQQYEGEEGRKGRRAQITGPALDSDEVYAFLRNGGFRGNMRRAQAWIASGRSHVVRYEDLHRDPVAALTRLTDAIRPAPAARIAAAIDYCSAENMRKRDNPRKPHVRSAKVGDSRQSLNDTHLAIFRDLHADLIRALGYEVR
jgi:hypothetical protein